ncbi:hypothetical protein RJ639_020899 [Escallonia herrerae]|uniref:DUF4378 domain-containing protein n=1 Tax=Escallonia herrerae TaxID=1293975 RepID=A0AA88V536_9ASTE|nr:hypothetical protein RJ639_020899 [Escallonia herrerae]
METKQHTSSVIAELMGLDELLPRQTIPKQRRVLSEDYLRKTASIDLLEKRSFYKDHYKDHLIRQETEKERDFEVVPVMDKMHDTQYVGPRTHSGRMAEDASTYRSNEKCRNSGKTSTLQVNLLRSLQKLEKGCNRDSSGDLDVDFLRNLFTSRSELKDVRCIPPTSIVVLKPDIRQAESNSKSLLSPNSHCGSALGDMELEFPRPINWELYMKVRDRGSQASASEPSRPGFRVAVGTTTEKEVFQQRYSSSSRKASNSEVRVGDASANEPVLVTSCASFFVRENQVRRTSHSSLNKSSSAKEVKKRISERWKVNKSSQKVGAASSDCTLGEMLANLNDRVDEQGMHRQLCLNGGKCAQGTGVIQDEPQNFFEESDVSKNFENLSTVDSAVGGVVSLSEVADIMADAETKDIGSSSESPHVQQSAPKCCNSLHKDGHSSSPAWDASTAQIQTYSQVAFTSQVETDRPYSKFEEKSTGSPENGYVSLTNCTRIDPEFATSCETYQPSPNSVLEPPFKEESIPGSENYENDTAHLHGLWMKLQLLESEAEDTESEELSMAVSSDEESREGSVEFLKENEKFLRLFRAEEGREFSYLVDVLDEAGFHEDLSFERWHSLQCPVSSSVFEELEKKYGEQMSWMKSERRLLFDCINLGLMEILQPGVQTNSLAKPLQKIIGTAFKRDVIEEGIWTLLISQGKEVSKNLSEKALGKDAKWLELGADVDIIAKEEENFLFDELVAELVH